MTGRPIDVERHFARPPERRGFPVTADGRPAGVVANDERVACSGAACKFCGAAVYDRAVLVAARWLAGHLVAEHGAERLGVDTRWAGALAAPLAAALTVNGRRAVA